MRFRFFPFGVNTAATLSAAFDPAMAVMSLPFISKPLMLAALAPPSPRFAT